MKKKYVLNLKNKEEKQIFDIECYEMISIPSSIAKKFIIDNPFTWGTSQHFAYVLRGIIAEHNRLYHMWDDPIISDGEYDKLMNRLKQHEHNFPETYHQLSPSNVVGSSCLFWPPEGTYNPNAFGLDIQIGDYHEFP
jgi:hypothetical protein